MHESPSLYELPQSIIEKYQENLALIQERVGLFANDPQRTPPDLLKSMFHTEKIIATKTSSLTPQDELEVIDDLENWYIERGLAFPNPDWLVNQRQRLTQKLRG